MGPAIIVVTYNRSHSLQRLLGSLDQAFYPHSDVALIISIDFQDSNDHEQVLSISEKFVWKYGEKRIIEHKENLGLRKHIISCGSLSEDYDSIIMLEDDIFVSPYFYDYSVQMLDYYGDKDYIAGISLYKHLRNVNANRPFYPQNNGFDVFYIQFAQSWGQCWSSKMWKNFYNWYLENQPLIIEDDMPKFVNGWPESSWLKFFIKYVVKTDKYFVYPFESLSTNFGDSGTHNKVSNNISQVSLQLNKREYKCADFDHAVKYDVFFERIDLELSVGIENTYVNLYGTKSTANNKRYLLTMETLPYKVIQSYGLNFRPHEVNLILNNKGEDIFLYDQSISVQNKNKRTKVHVYKQLLYDYPLLSRRNIFNLVFKKIFKL